jgi:hypothetical protein
MATYNKWRSLTCIMVVAIVLVIFFRLWTETTVRYNHRRWYRQVEAVLDDLEAKCPQNYSKRSWKFMIKWTRNGLRSCCGVPQFITVDNNVRDGFLVHLQEKVYDEPVEIQTIDWIWDQYTIISSYGRDYSAMFRPTKSVRLKGIDREEPVD